MKLNNLPAITTRSAKRVGRGLSSGKGKTAGRGTKGQKSRSGYNIPRRFEGGQTSLIQKLPKVRGFKSMHEKPETIRIDRLEAKFEDGEVVNFRSLADRGFIKGLISGVKVVGPAKLTKKIKFEDVLLTKSLLEQYRKMQENTSKKENVVEVDENKKTKKVAETK